MSLFQPDLSVTLVLDWYQTARDYYDPDYELSRNKKEEDIISRLGACPFPSNLYEDVSLKLDKKKVEDFLYDDYYDESKITQLTCALDSIFVPSVGHSSVLKNIKKWIKNPKLIDTPSNSGYAMIADFSVINNLMVLKSPRKKKKDLTHEYFVGTMINNLRRKIPNFALILGGFKCTPPLIGENKVYSWCNLDEESLNVKYVLYENVRASESLVNMIKTYKFNEFFPYVLQIAFALSHASKEYNFSHNDLHLANIIIRKNTTNKRWLMYEYFNKTVYVKADNIATIIDFGEANITVEGMMFGTTGNEKIGVYRNEPNTVRDFLRFFSSITMEAKVAGNDMFYHQGLRFLNRIFSDFQPSYDLNNLQKSWFSIPPPKYFQKYPTMDEIISVLEEAYPKNFNFYVREFIQDLSMVMSCEVQGNCTTPEDAFEYFGLLDYEYPKDIYSFYDAFANINKNERLDKIIGEYSIREIKRMILKGITNKEKLEHDIYNEYAKIRRVSLGEKTFNVFMKSLRKIDRYFRQIITLYELTSDLNRINEILNLIETVYNTKLLREQEPFDYENYIWSEVEFARELIDDLKNIVSKSPPYKLFSREKMAVDQIKLLMNMIDLI